MQIREISIFANIFLPLIHFGGFNKNKLKSECLMKRDNLIRFLNQD